MGDESAILSAETELYERHKAEWLQTYRNQFVVLKDEEILGFFTEFHNAYYAGVQKYGLDVNFLVKKIVSQEPVFVVF